MKKPAGLYILLISPHGLLRGSQLELGRDADTGGQIKYVVELAAAIAKHPDVKQVDLLTRLIADPKVSADYSKLLEHAAPGFNIVRIPCGPMRYLRKEALWPHLESFADNAFQYLRSIGRAPDLIHSHYADGGYIGVRLAGFLGIPLAYTGHSLGRVKRQRLLDQGMKIETIENSYHIGRRIEAEENALENASFVIASTQQEVDEQYSLYDNYNTRRMTVIPPGVDVKKFSPPSKRKTKPVGIQLQVSRFLKNPEKPMILAMSRPDIRKNINALVQAYGENEKLKEMANLVIIVGSRDDIRSMDKASRGVLTNILMLVDLYDLYGSVAYPKHHKADDVPEIYRMAAKTGGVFVNPALTEPFGLTILEAAASGLPVVVTENGGAREIVSKLANGALIDPLNIQSIGAVLESVLSNKRQLANWSKNGLSGARRIYSWSSHLKQYMRVMKKALGQYKRKRRIGVKTHSGLIATDRVLICDIDNTLTGDKEGLKTLIDLVKNTGDNVGFGVATGRSLKLALDVLKEWEVPVPNLLITSVGSAIHYGPNLVEDHGWIRHINYRWNREAIGKALEGIDGLKLQPKWGQASHKISYFVDPDKAPKKSKIVRMLRRAGLHAQVVYSHQAYLDILPIRASKGMALRYFAVKWGIPFDRLLVAGDSGNDEDMLTGNTLAVVVGNHSQELNKLRGRPQIYFSEGNHAWGIIEAVEHYNFFGSTSPTTSEGASL